MGDHDVRRRAAWRFVRAVIRSQASGVIGRRSVRPALAGRSGRGAADGQECDRPRGADEGPAHAADLARCAAGGRVAGDECGRRAAPVRDPEPGTVGRARSRRDLRARASPGRELPRPRWAGRADVACVVRLGARRADDGLDRPHDRLRPDGVRGRDRVALSGLATGADRVDPAAADLVCRLGVLAAIPRAHRAAAGAVGRGGHPGRGDRERHPGRERPRGRWPAGRGVPDDAAARSSTARSTSPGWMRCSCRRSSSSRCSG